MFVSVEYKEIIESDFERLRRILLVALVDNIIVALVRAQYQFGGIERLAYLGVMLVCLSMGITLVMSLNDIEI